MSDPLFEPVPDFDQPIAVLKHCHDRIRKQIGTMQKLVVHLSKNDVDMDAQQAAGAVLKYFSKAAPQHHADEECDLLPMLQATARDEDALLLGKLLPEIMREHAQMDASWQILDQQLKAVASGAPATLSDAAVNKFAEMYLAHMEKEETHIAPMAKRLFNQAQMNQLGDAMRARRNLAK